MKLLKKKSNLLFLLMLTFIFISSSAMSLSKGGPISDELLNYSQAKPSKYFPPNPVLGSVAAFPVVSAQGALAVDLSSGINLYEKNPDAKLLPASTTKIVTALTALDKYSLYQVLTVPKMPYVDGQKMGLTEGVQMTVENLLYGLLVYSANDAAETLAREYPEGYGAFISAMNSKAKELSMANSNFENPVGFDSPNQFTTAKDLVRVSEVAMRDPVFAKIVGTKLVTIEDVTGKRSYNLGNVNELLGSVQGVAGVKTGWTENARENLVTYIERDGHKIMIAVLGSQDRFGETKELIDWIFANYNWEEVKISYSP